MNERPGLSPEARAFKNGMTGLASIVFDENFSRSREIRLWRAAKVRNEWGVGTAAIYGETWKGGASGRTLATLELPNERGTKSSYTFEVGGKVTCQVNDGSEAFELDPEQIAGLVTEIESLQPTGPTWLQEEIQQRQTPHPN